MSDILNKLYSYEYFSVYLIVSIIVLVILFIFVLFFGKKDQKEREIEATKKLLKLEEDDNAFKEESEITKLETPSMSQEKLENDTIIVPSISDLEGNVSVNEIPEPVLPKEPESMPNHDIEEPVLEPKTNEFADISIPEEEPAINDLESPIEMEPVLSRVEEKPLVFSENNIENKIDEKDIVTIAPENVIEHSVYEEPVSNHEFNFDEIVNEPVKLKEPEVKEENIYKAPEIFSSVYAPPKEEESLESEIPVPTKEELEFELPTLKKEVVEEKKDINEKIEKPVLNDYNLDELSGETYEIK